LAAWQAERSGLIRPHLSLKTDDDQNKDRDADKTDKDRDEDRDEDIRTATSSFPIILVPIFVVTYHPRLDLRPDLRRYLSESRPSRRYGRTGRA